MSGLSTRTSGWYRAAVSGATQDEALYRATAVRQLCAPQVTISRPADKYAVAREFIPGEKLGTTAYKRRRPVTTLAAAVPTATAKVGDRVRIHLGETSRTRGEWLCLDFHGHRVDATIESVSRCAPPGCLGRRGAPGALDLTLEKRPHVPRSDWA